MSTLTTVVLVIVALGIMCNAFLAGYTYGLYKSLLLYKKPQPEKKTEYNESLANLLPNEVKQYYSETNGQNRF